MNLTHKNLKLFFFFSLLMASFTPFFFPSFRLYYFVPFIITCFYQKSFIACLWISLMSGCVVDIFLSGDQLGFEALIYVLTTFILFSRKQNFFSDSISTLPIMTYFYSLTVTALNAMVHAAIGKNYFIDFSWILSDLILMPLFDAIYAFSFFILPFLCFGKKRLRGTDYFIRS